MSKHEPTRVREDRTGTRIVVSGEAPEWLFGLFGREYDIDLSMTALEQITLELVTVHEMVKVTSRVADGEIISSVRFDRIDEKSGRRFVVPRGADLNACRPANKKVVSFFIPNVVSVDDLQLVQLRFFVQDGEESSARVVPTFYESKGRMSVSRTDDGLYVVAAA